ASAPLALYASLPNPKGSVPLPIFRPKRIGPNSIPKSYCCSARQRHLSFGLVRDQFPISGGTDAPSHLAWHYCFAAVTHSRMVTGTIRDRSRIPDPHHPTRSGQEQASFGNGRHGGRGHGRPETGRPWSDGDGFPGEDIRSEER